MSRPKFRHVDFLPPNVLVERRAVALHRQEILDRVWSDVVVSDGALSQAVRTLRRTLGDGTVFEGTRQVGNAGSIFTDTTGRKMAWRYEEGNRAGDHICYYSDLRKMRQHFPAWDITQSLEETIRQIVESWRQRQKA